MYNRTELGSVFLAGLRRTERLIWVDSGPADRYCYWGKRSCKDWSWVAGLWAHKYRTLLATRGLRCGKIHGRGQFNKAVGWVQGSAPKVRHYIDLESPVSWAIDSLVAGASRPSHRASA